MHQHLNKLATSFHEHVLVCFFSGMEFCCFSPDKKGIKLCLKQAFGVIKLHAFYSTHDTYIYNRASRELGVFFLGKTNLY
jgi:hypothetical protein